MPARTRSKIALASLAVVGIACAELAAVVPEEFRDLAVAGPLTESTVADGLKEALRVGTTRATDVLSEPGGFSGNPLLRLTLPSELDTMASALRTIGMGAQVDEVEAAMNRAAEQAAGEAVGVFVSAIASMKVQDAFRILDGPKTAATDYFRGKTTGALRQKFEPVVTKAMKDVGVYRSYKDVVARYDALPFSKPAAPSLEGTITEQTLDGLFSTLADEERRIRKDPAARSSELLRRVFDPDEPRATR